MKPRAEILATLSFAAAPNRREHVLISQRQEKHGQDVGQGVQRFVSPEKGEFFRRHPESEPRKTSRRMKQNRYRAQKGDEDEQCAYGIRIGHGYQASRNGEKNDDHRRYHGSRFHGDPRHEVHHVSRPFELIGAYSDIGHDDEDGS